MGDPAFTDQAVYDIRLEWGAAGLRALTGAGVANVVIVDVLSFTTCVSVAVDRGASVFPYPGDAEGAAAYAVQHDADVAGHRGDPSAEYSLSPASLSSVTPQTRLVLPSPNGSELSFSAPEGTVIAGCLRNRAAVAAYLGRHPGSVALVAAGERWPDRSLRPCLEDYLGAGAIASRLEGRLSPEARAAIAVYADLESELAGALASCSSGRELIELGYESDVEIAAQVDAANSVPFLRGRAFTRADGTPSS